MKRLAVVVSVACACATSAWTEAGQKYTPKSRTFAVELPEGWMRLRRDDELLATRDGPALQRIFSRTMKFGEPAERAKKAVRKGMLPEEAAEVVRDELASSGADQGLTVVENAPATLSQRPGFRLVFRYKTADGLTMKGLVYGVVGDDAVYGLGYVAPERHYFDLDLPTFEKVRASFTLLSAAQPSS